MKQFLPLFAILALVFLSSCVPPQQEPIADDGEVSYQEFYDGLSPYGHWIQNPEYGYVWIPEAGPDFVPYSTNGYWVWTDSYGWAWTSDYSWGWAPFHYGRWNYDDYYGWYWVPGLEWGPAWVAWREAPGYFGWCPLRPGVGVEIGFSGGYMPPDFWWTSCDGRYMGRREMEDHFDRGDHSGRIRGGESRAVGNAQDVGGGKRGFVTGPGKSHVEAITHAPIQAVKINHVTSPGESVTGNTWNLYRPPVDRTTIPKGQSSQTSQPAQPTQRTAPQTQPANNRAAQEPQNKSVPRSVTTPQDIRDLHKQAQESTGKPAPPPHNNPAPREQAPPHQQAAPRQQSAPREAPRQQAAPRSSGGGGKIK